MTSSKRKKTAYDKHTATLKSLHFFIQQTIIQRFYLFNPLMFFESSFDSFFASFTCQRIKKEEKKKKAIDYSFVEFSLTFFSIHANSIETYTRLYNIYPVGVGKRFASLSM